VSVHPFDELDLVSEPQPQLLQGAELQMVRGGARLLVIDPGLDAGPAATKRFQELVHRSNLLGFDTTDMGAWGDSANSLLQWL
jgi:hypothetical protein